MNLNNIINCYKLKLIKAGLYIKFDIYINKLNLFFIIIIKVKIMANYFDFSLCGIKAFFNIIFNINGLYNISVIKMGVKGIAGYYFLNAWVIEIFPKISPVYINCIANCDYLKLGNNKVYFIIIAGIN